MNNKKGTSQYIYYGIGQIINLIVPILIAAHIISICGMAYWGKIAIYITVFLVLNIFIDYGNLIIGVKHISVNRNNKIIINEYLKNVYHLKYFILILFIFLFLVLLFFQIFSWFHLLIGFLYIFSLAINPIWYFQAIEKYTSINKIIFCSRFLQLSFVILIINPNTDFFIYFLLLSVSNLLVYVYFFTIIIKDNHLTVSKIIKSNSLKILKEEWPIVLSNMSITLYVQLPILIINYLFGSFETGVFKTVEMTINIFRSYLGVFFSVTFPKFCKLYSENQATGFNYLKKINLLNITLLIVITIILYFLDLLIIKYFIETQYLYVYKLCKYSLLTPIIIAFNIPFYQYLLYKNKHKILSFITFFSTIVMFLLCFYLTKTYNIEGSLISVYLIESFVTASIILYFIKIYKS